MSRGHLDDPAQAWAADRTVEHYRTSRCGLEHFYDSEKRFLPELLAGAESVLDFGCATGGFFNVARHYSPNVCYTGVDICPEMIEAAGADHPEGRFEVFAGGELPFSDGSFDAVASLGVLHMTPDWRELVVELWRVTRKTLLFDLRVVEGPGIEDPEQSYQRMSFGRGWDGVSVAPYLFAGLQEVSTLLSGLEPTFGRLQAYGYTHPVSEMTVSPVREACMSVFLLSRTAGEGARVDWQLPVECPSELG